MEDNRQQTVGDGAKDKARSGRELYEWAQALVVSVLAVVLLFTFVVRLIGVDGHSMVPTLQDGDRLLVTTSLLSGEYQYGDIVIIQKGSFAGGEPIVKRVIATERQTVDIDFVTGTVYVDGEALQEDYINALTTVDGGVHRGGDGVSPDRARGIHLRHGR